MFFRLTVVNLPTVADRHRLARRPVLGTDGFHRLDHFVTLHDLSKDDVLAVEMRRVGGADEELRTVRVPSGVRHRQRTGAEVLAGLTLECLVREFLTVDRLPAGAVAAREVPPLAHEAGDDPMERRALEVKRLAA